MTRVRCIEFNTANQHRIEHIRNMSDIFRTQCATSFPMTCDEPCEPDPKCAIAIFQPNNPRHILNRNYHHAQAACGYIFHPIHNGNITRSYSRYMQRESTCAYTSHMHVCRWRLRWLQRQRQDLLSNCVHHWLPFPCRQLRIC